MKEIPLTRGKVTIVDDEDYDKVSVLTWHAYRNSSSGWYARSSILDCSPDKRVDHRDGNGLNNRRKNLREATQRQNSYNMGLRPNSISGYKGVSRYNSNNRYTGEWKSVIKYEGKTIYLGKFHDPKEAAIMYDAKARELFGEFARCNFPEGATL